MKLQYKYIKVRQKERQHIEYWRVNVWYRVLDSVISGLKSRFFSKNLKIATAIDKFLSLDFDGAALFIDH